jgi:hypothetical protein
MSLKNAAIERQVRPTSEFETETPGVILKCKPKSNRKVYGSNINHFNSVTKKDAFQISYNGPILQ